MRTPREKLPMEPVDSDDIFLEQCMKQATKCGVSGCRAKNVVSMGVVCGDCKVRYCIRHRLPRDHSCVMLAHGSKKMSSLSGKATRASRGAKGASNARKTAKNNSKKSKKTSKKRKRRGVKPVYQHMHALRGLMGRHPFNMCAC